MVDYNFLVNCAVKDGKKAIAVFLIKRWKGLSDEEAIEYYNKLSKMES